MLRDGWSERKERKRREKGGGMAAEGSRSGGEKEIMKGQRKERGALRRKIRNLKETRELNFCLF